MSDVEIKKCLDVLCGPVDPLSLDKNKASQHASTKPGVSARLSAATAGQQFAPRHVLALTELVCLLAAASSAALSALPSQITAEVFAQELLGFEDYAHENSDTASSANFELTAGQGHTIAQVQTVR